MDGRSLAPLFGQTRPPNNWRKDFLVEIYRPPGEPGALVKALRTRHEVYVEYADGLPVVRPPHRPVSDRKTCTRSPIRPIRGTLAAARGIGRLAGDPAKIESVVVNDGSAQRSMVNSLTVTFDRVVTFDPGAFGLRRQDGSVVGLIATSVVGGRTVAVLTFNGPGIIGGSLADGNYTLTIRGDRIRDEVGRELDGDRDGNGGGDRADAFFRLFGDSDGDRDVDWLDRDRFRSAFEKSDGDTGLPLVSRLRRRRRRGRPGQWAIQSPVRQVK